MNYPIPANHEEMFALRNKLIDEDLIATAIAGVIKIARSQGVSLEELTAEVLCEDQLLEPVQRSWLSEIVTQAWSCFPQNF